MNWTVLWSFHVSPLELIVRGTAMYWFLFLIFRFVMRRDVGSVGVADILLVVLIADASQNAMSGSYESVSEGCVLVATLIGWNYALDRTSFHSERVRRWLEPPPLLLVHHGRILKRNLREELLTIDDLHAQLRESGIESVADVKRAYMESDGKFSVVTYRRRPAAAAKDEAPPGTAS